MKNIIDMIPSSVYQKTGKAIDKMASTKMMTAKRELSVSDPTRFAASMLVTSIVTKDLVGCGFYTAQSYNNKKIPEDKRKFIAALDLVNGILMVGGQFAIGKIIDAKVTPWLSSKFTGVLKDVKTGKEKTVNPDAFFHPDHLKKMLEKNNSSIDTEKAIKFINKTAKEPFLKGFSILVAAIATTAITKRTLVPLISTPIAGGFKSAIDKKSKNTQADAETDKAISTAVYNKTDDTVKTK